MVVLWYPIDVWKVINYTFYKLMSQVPHKTSILFIPFSDINGGSFLGWWLWSISFIPKCYPLSMSPIFPAPVYSFPSMFNIINSLWYFQFCSFELIFSSYTLRGHLCSLIILILRCCCWYTVSLAFGLVLFWGLYAIMILIFPVWTLFYVIHTHFPSPIVSISVYIIIATSL